MRPALVPALLLWILTGCGSVVCECDECPAALRLDVRHAVGVTPVVTGAPSLRCRTEGGVTTCRAEETEPGAAAYEVSAAGETPRTVEVSAERDTSGGCCGCRWRDRRVTVELGVPADGSAPADGDGGLDAGGADAGPDASLGDAGSPPCRPERVRFPMGGELAPGTLCDDVFVCSADAAAVARLQATSSRFDCSEPVGFPCEGGTLRCAYRGDGGGGPSVLDEREIADLCAVTTLEPPPDAIVCVVYL